MIKVSKENKLIFERIFIIIFSIGITYMLPGFWYIARFFFTEIVFGKTNASELKDWSSAVYYVSGEFWGGIIGNILGLIDRLTH